MQKILLSYSLHNANFHFPQLGLGMTKLTLIENSYSLEYHLDLRYQLLYYI